MKAVLIALMLFGHWAGAAVWAAESKPDYQGMVNSIDTMLGQAAADYRAGKAEDAKTAVQHAYFQIFEGLEGPIRINISSKRSYQLESEFGAIRKLMTDGAPPAEVESRISALIKALGETVPLLEKGAVLVGQKGDDQDAAAQPEPQAPQPSGKVEPYWQRAVAVIHTNLMAAADALEKGDPAKAKALITQARFDGYKNSQLEIAIRRFVSQQQDGAYEAEFNRIAGLVDDGRPANLIRGSARVLAEDLTARLPGLPLVGAAADKVADEPAPSADWADVAAKVNAAVAKALALAGGGNRTAAVDLLQSTYFDVFEASSMEAQVGAHDPAFKTQLEAHFSKLMALVTGGSAADLAVEAEAMKADLVKAVTMLTGNEGTSPTALFSYALLIILREGFEAIIIVTALIAYLVKTGHHDKQRVIGNSVIFALLASVATAIVFKLVVREAAASQEVLEGSTMLLAAVVLFSVSYWLISKAEAKKWTSYIKDKVEGSLSTGSMRALWFTGFLAVYREGAETVLFYQALTVQAADTMGLAAIAAGFGLGCLGLGLIYWTMRAGALKLPIRPFFQATGALLYAMAFVFAGQGVMELVEGKVLTPTLLTWAPEVPALGIYPYWQSLLPQAVLLIAAAISLAVILRQRAQTTVRTAGGTAISEGRKG